MRSTWLCFLASEEQCVSWTLVYGGSGVIIWFSSSFPFEWCRWCLFNLVFRWLLVFVGSAYGVFSFFPRLLLLRWLFRCGAFLSVSFGVYRPILGGFFFGSWLQPDSLNLLGWSWFLGCFSLSPLLLFCFVLLYFSFCAGLLFPSLLRVLNLYWTIE